MTRKYYVDTRRSSPIEIECQWNTGFFKKKHISYTLLFYEENGKFYELLTGKCLGKRTKLYNYEYLCSDELELKIALQGWSYGCYASEVSAERFAELARGYVPYKEQIVPYINKWFCELRTKKAQTKAEEKARLSQQKIQNEINQKNVNWLENFLNNRK